MLTVQWLLCNGCTVVGGSERHVQNDSRMVHPLNDSPLITDTKKKRVVLLGGGMLAVCRVCLERVRVGLQGQAVS